MRCGDTVRSVTSSVLRVSNVRGRKSRPSLGSARTAASGLDADSKTVIQSCWRKVGVCMVPLAHDRLESSALGQKRDVLHVGLAVEAL
jgi:hypothetical protein